jgi:hypothetical protein
VRSRVGHAFAEKASEIADAIEIVQGLSKEATRQFQGAVGAHTPFNFARPYSQGAVSGV